MRYEAPLYRPPSEANSFIVQATIGCSWNRCTFCSMYRGKKFRMRAEEEILDDLQKGAQLFPHTKRLFLADGNALVLPTERLLTILKRAYALFPNLHRVSAYATVLDLEGKTLEELKALQEAGLNLLYIGLESGAPEVLRRIEKECTPESFIVACKKAKESGLRISITLIAGLGDKENRCEDAKATAQVISAIKPDFVSYLTLYLEPGAPLFDDREAGLFKMPTPAETLEEIRCFLEEVDAERCVFRSNHASNYVSLAGTLNVDREALIATIDKALQGDRFRPESRRAL